MKLQTKRLDLVAATPDMVRAALHDVPALGRLLPARITSEWPPELLDTGALEWTLDKLLDRPGSDGWWLYFVVLRDDPNASGPTLIGSVGYKGPPENGSTEVGYGILPAYQRRGFATECVHALVARAFDDTSVNEVLIETLPSLTPSIGVATKCGFTLVGEGSEPGVIRFARSR